MWSEAAGIAQAEKAATDVRLEDLIAMKPALMRGTLPSGARQRGGERRGRGRARSLEFDGLSPYAPGDDVRAIDWRATARSGRTQVRRFAAQSHRARMIVVDLVPSLWFGTSGRLMAKTAVLQAARLAWEASVLVEPVGLIVGGREIQPPRRGQRHVLGLLDALVDAFRLGGRVPLDPVAALDEAASVLRRGDQIDLVAEGVTPTDPFVSLSRSLSAVRSLRAFLVEDPLVLEPVPPGHYPVRLPVSGVRQVAGLGQRAGARLPEVAAVERQRVLDAFRDCGWQVSATLNLLPRGEERR